MSITTNVLICRQMWMKSSLLLLIFLIIVKLLLLPSLIVFVIESSSRTGRKTLKQLYPLNDLSLVQGDSLDLCCNANIEQYAYHYYYRC